MAGKDDDFIAKESVNLSLYSESSKWTSGQDAGNS